MIMESGTTQYLRQVLAPFDSRRQISDNVWSCIAILSNTVTVSCLIRSLVLYLLHVRMSDHDCSLVSFSGQYGLDGRDWWPTSAQAEPWRRTRTNWYYSTTTRQRRRKLRGTEPMLVT